MSASFHDSESIMRIPCHSRTRRLTSVVLLMSLAAGCGGGDSVAPAPVAVTITPTTATVNAGGTQDFSATVANATNSSINWTTTGGTLSATTGASVTFTAPLTGGPFTITATSAADATKSAAATVSVTPIGVSISPSAVTVGAAGTQQFSATVANSTNTGVTWTASGGTITGSGATATYTAPAAGGSYTVTATSTADPTKSATSTVTVTPISIAVTPGTQTVFRGQPISLSAAVTGTANDGLQWAASCGTIVATGTTATYTAPNTPGACTVTARSTLDTTRAGTATLTVRNVYRVAVLTDTDDGACTWTHCTLREALTAAQAGANADSILIVATTANTITLTSALPTISTPVHIVGPGASLVTLNAGAAVGNDRRVLTLTGDVLGSVSGLTMRGGVALGGGALSISAKANIALNDLVIVDNESRGAAGGGIAVFDSARVQLARVVIDSNRTFGTTIPGGGLSASAGAVVSMNGGRLHNNTVSNGWGGALRVLSASLTMDSVSVRGNRVIAGAGGGGLMIEGTTSTATLNRLTVSENTTVGQGGGLWLRNLTMTIANSTISGNSATSNGGGVVAEAITLTSTNNAITGNTGLSGAGVFSSGATVATFNGGSIADNRASGSAGGVFLSNTSRFTMTNVTVSGNETLGTGIAGGFHVAAGTELIMTNSTIASNRAKQNWGGGIYAVGSIVTLTDVIVRNNIADSVSFGGGIAAQNAAVITMTRGALRDNRAVAGGGGGLMLATASAVMTDVLVSGNTSLTNGGGMQIFGASAATLNNVILRANVSGQNGGGANVATTSTLTVNGGVVDSNRAPNSTGGGISKVDNAQLTMTGTRVTNNSAPTGGGIVLSGGSTTILRGLTVSGNTATVQAPGIISLGNMTLENSTISGNSSPGPGGGVYSLGAGSGAIRNTTVSGNSASIGGGVLVNTTLLLNNLTVVGNTATTAGAGIHAGVSDVQTATMTVTNSLIAANTVGGVAQNCARGAGSVIVSSGYNLSDDATCTTFTATGDKANTTSGVNATLADNGGPTRTHALSTGSAAINAGNASTCVVTDQRGYARAGVCDIGAFEFGGTPPAGARTTRATTVAPQRRRPMPSASTASVGLGANTPGFERGGAAWRSPAIISKD
ncbi:MAG: hypothetical protein IT353_18625 [Gemmatimonadaceae bacterium]|nr:hypothetical protein [Gemmatimonadaceae bacterium]